VTPRFDIWFWLLVIWSLFAPMWFDHGHIESCREFGEVKFHGLRFWEEPRVFECGREIASQAEDHKRSSTVR
jgi:hypothetical protein